jgi:hypothetical protein
VICYGNNTTLFGSGANTYTWTGGVTNNVAFTPTTTATYSVTGTSTAGCTSTNSAAQTVTVNPLPVVAANVSNSVICNGNSTTLFGSGANTYTWTGGVVNNVAFSPTVTTTYTVTGTSTAGCTSTNSAVQSVTVNPRPVISAASGSICNGSSFVITPSGASTYTFSSGSATVSPATTTSYSVSGTNSLGCVSVSPAVVTVTVVALPVVTANVTNSVICNGNNTTLFGSGANTYTWTGGVTNNVAFSPPATASYSMTGTSAAGCTSTNSAVQVVTVNPRPVISASGGTICSGSVFTIVPSGASSYTFSSGTSTVNPSSTTSYSVSGTNSLGCTSATPAIITVTVYALPVITVNSGSICAGNSFTMVPSGAATYTYSSGSPVVTPSATTFYTLTGTSAEGCQSPTNAVSIVTVAPLPTITVNSGSICVGTSFTLNPSGATTYTYINGGPVVSPTTTTIYSVTGSSSQGCNAANYGISNVTVVPRPIITVNSGSICSGSSFTINPSGAATYTFAGGSAVVSPTSNTSYTVTGTSSAGCDSQNPATSNVIVNALPIITATGGAICLGQVFTHTVSGAVSYTYSSGSSTVSPGTTTTYSINGTSLPGCVSGNPAVITVTVYPVPTLSVTGNSSICIGESQTLTANGASSYTWNVGSGPSIVVTPSLSSTYTVQGSNSDGCLSIVESMTVTVNSLPTITVSDGAICPGNAFTLSPSGAATYTYSSGSNVVFPTVTSNYTITGTSAEGCESTLPAVATVSVVNILTVTISGPNSVCEGSSIKLTANGASTYSWSTGALTNTISEAPSTNTTYTVVGSSGNCSDSTSISITVKPLPVITINSTSTLLCNGQNAQLTSSGALNYSWLGGLGTGTVITINPTVTTSYQVVGIDASGCSDTASYTQVVSPCENILNHQKERVEIQVFPNPNLGSFTILATEDYKMEVLNVLGQTILVGELNSGRNAVNLTNQSNGVYFVRVTKGLETKTIRVVKQ